MHTDLHNSLTGLIGFSGFVGSSLLRQAKFSKCYRSTNIAEIEGESFNTLVCAGAPAQKWLANRHPEEDRQKIETLMNHLRRVRCQTLILISTVDVFQNPLAVREDSAIDESGLQAYGLHRRWLEKMVQNHFAQHLIIRLPGLVGPGLKKNVLFDFLNHNNLTAIDSRSVFQFYPMVNLWRDIQLALQAKISLLHLTAEPMSVAQIAQDGFGRCFEQTLTNTPATYDMQTLYSPIFGGSGHYTYSRRESLLAIRAYAQSEPVISFLN